MILCAQNTPLPLSNTTCKSDAQKWRELRDQQRYSNKQWRPRKRLTRYEIDHLKILHRELPQENTIEKLAIKFSISQQAVRRILKSKFEPTPEIQERQDRKALAQKEERQNKWRMRTEEMEDKLAVK